MTPYKSLLLVLFISFGGVRQGIADETFLLSGKCRNVTHSLDGFLRLTFTEKNRTIEGYMSVSGWLLGSGPLKGTRDGDKVKFQTRDAIFGTVIDWQGDLKNSHLSGEYFVAPDAARGLGRQVGEWDVTVLTMQSLEKGSSAATSQEILKMLLEVGLNAPVTRTDGSIVTGAENLFQATHPIGQGVSVRVESVDIDWKAESKTFLLEDIHKFRATYVLYWQGIIRPLGWTRLNLSYNAKLDAVTAHEVVESTGTTRQEFNDIAFGVGFLLGQAAIESVLGSK